MPLAESGGMEMKMSKEERKIQIVLFFIASTLFFVSFTAYESFLQPMGEEMGLAPGQIGLIVGASGLISMFARFPIGVLSQMFAKRKLVIQLGLFITVIPWIAAFLFPTFSLVWLARALSGLTAATWVMYTVLFSTYFSEEEIPQSISVINIASSIGPIIGTAAGGYAAHLIEYRYSVLVAVAAAAINIVLIFFLKEPENASVSTPAHALSIAKEQFTDLNVWKIGLMATLPMMATYAYIDYLTPSIITTLGGGAAEIAVAANCFRIACIVASPLVGYFFYKKLGVNLTIAVGAIVLGACCVAMPWMTNMMEIYILHFGIGFFFTMNFTMLLSLIIMGVPGEHQTTRMGLLQSIYAIGLGFGPMLSGILTESLTTAQCAAVMGGACIILALFTKPLVPKKLLRMKEAEK